jgi:hypothetical protein
MILFLVAAVILYFVVPAGLVVGAVAALVIGIPAAVVAVAALVMGVVFTGTTFALPAFLPFTD